MGAAVDDAPFVEHEDLVGIDNRADTLGDDEAGAVFHQPVERVLDEHFGRNVDIAGGVVQDQDARVGQQGAGDGDALFLASGKRCAALADRGLVSVGKTDDEVVRGRGPGGGLDLGVGGLGAAEGDVVAYGAGKEVRLLQHDADLPPHAVEGNVAHVPIVDKDLPFADVVEAGDEIDDGRLAAARATQ